MSNVSRPKTIGRLLSFDSHTGDGIEIIDHIERRRCRINIQEKISPTSISAENFHFPVDQGVSITASELSLPYSIAVHIRNHAGLMINQLTSGDCQDLPYDRYSIELSTPIKLYLISESEISIEVTDDNVKIDLGNSTEVYIGARSHHEHPAGTITTTADPEDMMKAVSHLSSALKTTSCERSYPTLRGHPPEITLGDRLQIPQVLDNVKTGIEIEIPPNYRSIYVVSPLAYYFGADIVPGESRVIRTSHGFSHSLGDADRTFEQEVNRVLRQCFFMDCLTRTEGYYKINLNEREQLERELDVDFISLYGKSLLEQIKEYLTIRYEDIKPYIPRWKQTAYVEVAPKHVEILPFLIHDLAAVHSTKNTEVVRSNIKNARTDGKSQENIAQTNDTKTRHAEGQFTRGDSSCLEMRSGESASKDIEPEEYVQLPDDSSLEQTWIGDGIPIGASKSMLAAFKNRLRRDPTEGDIEISVVVNDDQMIEEGETVDEVYETREQLGLSVDIYHQQTVDELYELFQRDTDFLHYIGHIDNKGFQCIDGQLDVTKMESVSIDSFFLNACLSYQQAIGLINAGSIAGIATIKPVLNSGAELVGKMVARLLNLGFPLTTALNIAKSKSIMGDNYVIIGDGGLDLTQPTTGVPSSCEIVKRNDEFEIIYRTYLTRAKSIGSITIPYINENQQFYLTSGSAGKFSMNIKELLRFLSEDKLPVKIGSRYHWSDEVTIEKLMENT